MFWKTIFLFLICYHVKAQDVDCNYYQQVVRPKTYYMQTPEYPYRYTPGRVCMWVGECIDNNSICILNCQIEMPETPNCNGDRLLISRSGDENLIGAEKYCGTKNLTNIASFAGKIVVGLVVSKGSKGGRFRCRLKSKITKATSNPPRCRCGEIKQTRIVGGNATGEHQYSMMAGIRDINTFDVFCGGSIIKPDWVLSAAHCGYEEGKPRLPRDLRILVGHRDTQKCITYQVRQFFTHPDYKPDGYENDVSLFQTLTNMQLNDNVQPVCLPYPLYTDNLVGDVVTELGWGTLDVGKPTTNILQQVQVGVVSTNYCQQSYPGFNITSKRLCTYAKGKDSCQMDSGGPLLVNKGGNWFLAGVVSFGVDCAPPIPSVNTRISPYLNWITKTIGPNFICVKTLNGA